MADEPRSSVPRPWQPRFGIGAMLLVMVVVSAMAAAGYYFVQFLRGGRPFQLTFILFTLIAPLLLTLGISLFRAAAVWFNRPASGR